MSSHDWFGLTEQKYVYRPYSAAFPDLFKKEKEPMFQKISAFIKERHD